MNGTTRIKTTTSLSFPRVVIFEGSGPWPGTGGPPPLVNRTIRTRTTTWAKLATVGGSLGNIWSAIVVVDIMIDVVFVFVVVVVVVVVRTIQDNRVGPFP